MGIRNFPVVSIGSTTGTREDNVTAAGAFVAIPTMQGGTPPKFLSCKVSGGNAGEFITVSPTQDANGSITTGLPVFTGEAGIILNVHGFTSIGTAASADGTMELHLYPLEDF